MKTFANLKGEEHYICSVTGWKDEISVGIVWPSTTYFCSCGYNKAPE